VQIGAIITVPGGIPLENPGSGDSSLPKQNIHPFDGIPFACYEILGQTLLRRTTDYLRTFGVEGCSVIFEDSGSSSLFPSRVPSVGKFFSAWESAVGQHLSRGADVIILLRLSGHVEVDYAKLIEFHMQTSSVLTQVYDTKSAFEIAVVDADQLRGEKGSFRGRLSALIPYHRRYSFNGYSNRLRQPQDFRRLVQDALLGRNSLRPVGPEVRPGVWVSETADVHSTARIMGPAYIGAHARIKSTCVIKGATAIERNSEVDSGTVVNDSCVLPGTYLGAGLNFAHSIIAANKLFHLDRNIEVEIADRKLVAKRRSLRAMTRRMGEKRFFTSREGKIGTAAAPSREYETGEPFQAPSTAGTIAL